MNKTKNKYFALIWATIVIGYNAILFLLVSTIDKEVFKAPAFWVLYAWMMIAFLIWLFVGSFEVGDLKFLTTFTYPYLAIVFLVTTILYFWSTKIDKLAFIIIPMLFFTVILVILMILGMVNKKMIKNNPQQLRSIEKVEELSPFFIEISEKCNGQFKRLVEDLVSKCQNLTSSDDENIKRLDQKLIEYATFIKKNAINEEINIENNVKKFEEILAKRAK